MTGQPLTADQIATYARQYRAATERPGFFGGGNFICPEWPAIAATIAERDARIAVLEALVREGHMTGAVVIPSSKWHERARKALGEQ